MISTADKAHLREVVASAFDEFTASLLAFDDTLVNTMPFEGSWTPAQVAIHILLATDGVPDEKTAPSNRAFDVYLAKIRPWWEDLDQKFKSPQPLHPDSKPRQKSELLSELHRVREKDLAIIAEKDLTLVCLDFELPTIGYLTRFEWLCFIEMHLRRHTFQLKNMRIEMGRDHP